MKVRPLTSEHESKNLSNDITYISNQHINRLATLDDGIVFMKVMLTNFLLFGYNYRIQSEEINKKNVYQQRILVIT